MPPTTDEIWDTMRRHGALYSPTFNDMVRDPMVDMPHSFNPGSNNAGAMPACRVPELHHSKIAQLNVVAPTNCRGCRILLLMAALENPKYMIGYYDQNGNNCVMPIVDVINKQYLEENIEDPIIGKLIAEIKLRRWMGELNE